jgi:predicted DNA-binding transcriptional regulator YafY
MPHVRRRHRVIATGHETAIIGDEVRIVYRNYRGEVAKRRIIPGRIWFGGTEWHPEPQWLLDAVDLEKGATRSFALRDIVDFDPDE